MEEDQVFSEEYKCSICSKSCGNKKSQIRHISYCQKSRSRVRSRKKSCLACTKAKTRCDLEYPSCSRCITKNLTCGYEQPRLPKPPPRSQGDPIAELPLTTTTATTLGLTRPLALDEHADPFPPLQSPVLDPAEFIYSDSSTRNFESTDFNCTYLESSVPAHNTSQLTYPRSPSPAMGFTAPASMDYPSFELIDGILYEFVISKGPKWFVARTIPEHQFSLNRNFLLCTLHSYPRMILPGKILPPFMHPHLATEVSRDGQLIRKPLPRPLASCAAIMQMCLVKNENNTLFIWRTIRMEQERISAEYLEYDDVTLVAALQAVTIYCLLRLSEDNDEATNFDIPLIFTLWKIAAQAHSQIMRYGTLSDGRMPKWKDWILEESVCRITTLIYLVNNFFDFLSPLPFENCDGRWLLTMPLPCARDLWKAESSTEWEREYLARGGEMGLGKKLRYDDLLKWGSRQDHSLDSWLSQLDEFGTLVMAAASLPSYMRN